LPAFTATRRKLPGVNARRESTIRNSLSVAVTLVTSASPTRAFPPPDRVELLP
jgi:hypothetical protein